MRNSGFAKFTKISLCIDKLNFYKYYKLKAKQQTQIIARSKDSQH